MLRIVVMLSVSLFLAFSAFAEFPKAYVGSPEVRDLALSPQGHEIVTLKTDYEFGVIGRRTWDNLEFMDTYSGDVRRIHDVENRLYFWVYWPFEDMVISQALNYEFGRRDVDIQPVLLAINPETGAEKVLYQGKRQDWEKDFETPKIAGYSSETREVAIQTTDKSRTNLVAINVDNGQERLMERGKRRTLRWTLNDDFEPILRFDRGRNEAEEVIFAKDSEGKWVQIERVNRTENEFVPNTAPTESESILVMHRPDGAERAGLYEYSLATNSFGDLVFEHPDYDLLSMRGTRDGELLYAEWAEDGFEKVWLHSDYESYGRMLDKAFKPEDNWTVVETSQDGSRWLIYVSSPVRPGSWFHFDTQTKRAKFLINLRPDLKKNAVSKIQRVDYTARDGLALYGYFTPSKLGPNSPVIVMPHGGPVARDYADFDGYAQFLAYKGYHVFQPQFRGGGGQGLSFERAGHGEWGKAMQTDIEDGVAALIDQGLLHPSAPRSIFGFSYGGYAALTAASLFPDNYQCAISVNGVSDLPLFFKQFSKRDEWEKAALAVWTERIGDPETRLKEIKTVSPLHNAASIKSPILLIHGDQDSVVHPVQSERLFKTLDARGHDVTYHILEDQGHQIWNEDERTNLLVYVDNFLMRCMPPRPVQE